MRRMRKKTVIISLVFICGFALIFFLVDVIDVVDSFPHLRRIHPPERVAREVRNIFHKFYRDKDSIKDFDEVLSHELGLWIDFRKGLRQLEDPIGKSRQIAALLEYALLKKEKIELERSVPLMQRLKNERIGHIGWWCRQVLKAYGLQEGSGSEGSGE